MGEAKLLHPPPRGRIAARRPGAGGETLLDAGRRFLRCRDRSLAHAARHTPPRRYPSPVASPGPRDAAASGEPRGSRRSCARRSPPFAAA